ncbi:hypothetical protein [Schnuerera sp.]|uniref:hypothetical protein n=1 Tax=Schnuerera sp. TaxID=2794844 RepID=UPI002CB03AC5|nr:hypothetical protein [Schnuerera sp.]HSH36310.1 hypothetical protein [Schnuerera sp.]
MLNTFKNEYLKLYRESKEQQWDNYFEGGNHDLGILDNKIYELVNKYSNKIEILDRESQVANLIIIREKVDRNQEVSKLRNYIDDLENYGADISEEIKKDDYRYRSVMANKMKKDVLQLMKIRNALAIENGYDSYPDLILETNGVDYKELNILLHNYLEKNLHKAIEIIKKYNIIFENWFDDLDKIDRKNKDYDSNMLIEKLLNSSGFPRLMEKVEIKYVEDGFSGYATELEPNNMRMAVEPIKSLDSLRTLFHELGHVMNYGLNKEEGLFRILPFSLDESMAVIFEYIASVLLLNGEDKIRIQELMTLEYTRCAISAIYEFDLWKHPNRAEELFEYHYKKLGVEIKDTSIWALDSFRSIDPVYIHNYVMGASMAEGLIRYLKISYENDYESWGKWLYSNIYYDGWKRDFREKGLILLQ